MKEGLGTWSCWQINGIFPHNDASLKMLPAMIEILAVLVLFTLELPTLSVSSFEVAPQVVHSGSCHCLAKATIMNTLNELRKQVCNLQFSYGAWRSPCNHIGEWQQMFNIAIPCYTEIGLLPWMHWYLEYPWIIATLKQFHLLTASAKQWLLCVAMPLKDAPWYASEPNAPPRFHKTYAIRPQGSLQPRDCCDACHGHMDFIWISYSMDFIGI